MTTRTGSIKHVKSEGCKLCLMHAANVMAELCIRAHQRKTSPIPALLSDAYCPATKRAMSCSSGCISSLLRRSNSKTKKRKCLKQKLRWPWAS